MASKDVMIDIETLSLDSDALVLSIGAVKFDCIGNEGPWFSDETFIAIPSILEQLLLCRSVSKGTQKFWSEQEIAAQAHWAGPAVVNVKMYEALMGLRAYVGDAPRVWANGAVFDFGILESLYRQFGQSIPWKYNAVRDARTFYDTNPEVRSYGATDDMIKHHPLADCKVQIIRLWEHGYGK